MQKYIGQQAKPLTIAALAVGVLALTVLAITLISAEWSAESTSRMLFDTSFLNESAIDGTGLQYSPMTALLVNLLMISMVLAVLYASISNPGQALRAAILCLLILFGARSLMSTLKEVPPPPGEVQEDAPLSEETPEFGEPVEGIGLLDPPDWFASALLAGFVAVLGIALAGMAWIRFRPIPERTLDLPQQIVDDAQQALSDIAGGYDLRSAIINAWLQMNRTLRANRGIVRQDAATAREFEHQLHGLGFPSESVSRLTRLFEQVRYSPEEPGPREQREAVDCLEMIVNSGAAAKQSVGVPL